MPTTTAPAWATPHVPGSVPDWRLWHEPTMRGMMADLGARHPGWTAVWWPDLRSPAPSGADDRTWFAVWAEPLAGTNLRPCIQFSSWDFCDASLHRVAGAPLRIAATPALWMGGYVRWRFGTYWHAYEEWSAPGALEHEWGQAARVRPFQRRWLPADEEEAAQERATALRRERRWASRSAILAWAADWVADDTGTVRPRPQARQMGAYEAYRSLHIEERAEAICWESAEDDLPWGDAPRPVLRPTPQSLFAGVVSRG